MSVFLLKALQVVIFIKELFCSQKNYSFYFTKSKLLNACTEYFQKQTAKKIYRKFRTLSNNLDTLKSNGFIF